MSEDLDQIARAIIDGNRYMVLGTADESGRPWVSPVYYAPSGYAELYWVSSPEAQHSRNLAARPELSIVVFDSQAPVGEGQGVYMSAIADELEGVAGRAGDRGLLARLGLARREAVDARGRSGARRPCVCTVRACPSTGSSTRSAGRTNGRRSGRSVRKLSHCCCRWHPLMGRVVEFPNS